MRLKLGFVSVLAIVAACANCLAQEPSCRELTEILDIKTWRVPMPKDERFEWSIRVVDYSRRKFAKIDVSKLNVRRKALVALRDTGNDTFEFTLKNRAGRGQGDLEINICTEQEKKNNSCDNAYSITWHEPPMAFDGGTKFLLADIIGDEPRKQIVLELVKFRLEDILRDRVVP